MVTVAKQGGIENEKKLANFLMVNNTFFINSQLHDTHNGHTIILHRIKS